MGTSPVTIDRHYGHLARDSRQHAIARLDAVDAGGRSVDTASTGGNLTRRSKTRR